jgi:hypothetical protein
MKALFPIECHISYLKLEIQLFSYTSLLEERLLYLEQLDEQCQDAALDNDVQKKKIQDLV